MAATDFASTVVEWFNATYCVNTLSNVSATTCGLGASGLVVVVLGVFAYVAFDTLKNVGAQVIKDRPIGLAVLCLILAAAFYFPNVYAVIITLVLVAAWALFAKQLSEVAFSFPFRRLTLDNAVILLAPIIYMLFVGATWAYLVFNPPPSKIAAIVLLPSPLQSGGAQKDVLPQIRIGFGDVIGKTYEVLPSKPVLDDFENYFKSYARSWDDIDNLLNEPDLKDRDIELVRCSISDQQYDNGGWSVIIAETQITAEIERQHHRWSSGKGRGR